MASRKDKTAYDALLRDARALTDDLDLTREENYSLEEILAEYGGGRERKILDDVERQVAGEALPEAEAPAAGSDPGRAPERGPKPAKDREATPFRVPEAAEPGPGPEPASEVRSESAGSKVRLFRRPGEEEPEKLKKA